MKPLHDPFPPTHTLPKPRFTHDCNTCVYLGHFDRHVGGKVKKLDLYWCAKRVTHPALTESDMASMIGRFGSDGPDYTSTMPPESIGGDYQPPEVDREILGRALIRGLYRPWNRRKELQGFIETALDDLRLFNEPDSAIKTLLHSGLGGDLGDETDKEGT